MTEQKPADHAVHAVVILGLARQGQALARFYAQQGVRVTVSDSRSAGALRAAMDELGDLDINFVLGDHPLSLLEGCDLVCLSGGVPLDLPLAQEARRRGIRLSNDAQEFLVRCPAPVVGITGSAGKTTTTSLVGAMLAASGVRTWVGGNIGNPLINELPEMHPEDRVVMELSSFQLELMETSPQIAGVLNITPNHLDRHKTMDVYIAAKRAIVANQRRGDVAVLGYDEANARGLSDGSLARVRYFSGQEAVEDGAFLSGDQLMLRGPESGTTAVIARDLIRLRGYHNVLNVLAAIALADAAGATLEGMRSAIAAFRGVAHRLEEVRRVNGVLWVNDSIATAPERVLAALEAFDEPLILLAGGRDKDLPWERFAERVVGRVRILVLFGEAAPLIHSKVAEVWKDVALTGVPAALEAIEVVGRLGQAVGCAAERARSGEVVLLSPGGTSFDAFADFAERGTCFRELVLAL
ncbi:MAG: UDP-N-acetylmuramoyl-L-alanine--D-glutamate ligase [Anaerolineae bacterium]|nr:UDP-N-acetylmuramoyl-L-alanine--D-glutamate ligase [Anaerolineae bacterium]